MPPFWASPHRPPEALTRAPRFLESKQGDHAARKAARRASSHAHVTYVPGTLAPLAALHDSSHDGTAKSFKTPGGHGRCYNNEQTNIIMSVTNMASLEKTSLIELPIQLLSHLRQALQSDLCAVQEGAVEPMS